MVQKIKRFDGGGNVDYGGSWADYMPADSQSYAPDQTITPTDGGQVYTLPGMAPEFTDNTAPPAGPGPEVDAGPLTLAQIQADSPNLSNHLYPRGQDPNGHLQATGDQNGMGVFTKILQGMGIAGKDGNVDISNPSTMDKILKTIFTGGSILSTLQGPQNKKSPQELQAALKGPFDSFQGPAAAAANSYFGTQLQPHKLAYLRDGASLVPTKRYAEGGDVNDDEPQFHSTGALSALNSSYVRGHTGGQADLVPARVAHGEYVWDADAVSAIGDGNNEAGAHILDKWRENLRKHKRSAPPESIPPKFKSVNAYMPKKGDK